MMRELAIGTIFFFLLALPLTSGSLKTPNLKNPPIKEIMNHYEFYKDFQLYKHFEVLKDLSRLMGKTNIYNNKILFQDQNIKRI